MYTSYLHCKCNAKVDEIGCSKSSGRFSRQTEINSIINRSLTSIHVNSTLESNRLSRDNGKRPDGMTLVPWIKGQPLVGGCYYCRYTCRQLKLVPTLMIDDAETKMRTEAAVLFELKTSVPFCHTLQVCELIYVD
jgi:hypothetical protein